MSPRTRNSSPRTNSPQPGELDLLIAGGGAAGLMAAVAAAEQGLRCLLLEGRHRPGQKLLLCGNNRCNVTHEVTADQLLAAYGGPVASFLTPAVHAFPPTELRQWFARHGLQTTVHADERVFPASEKADDVVHCFRDALRKWQVPLVLNCPVLGLRREGKGWCALTANVSLPAPHILLATGGVSYPKTGSVGDGQRFARDLGHRVIPYRPGLAGIVLEPRWLAKREPVSLPDTELAIFCRGQEMGRTHGEILLDRTCARGPAMVNASRLMAREDLRDVEFRVDLFPDQSETDLAQRLGKGGNPGTTLLRLLPRPIALELARDLPPTATGLVLAKCLKAWRLPVLGVRPLKEAMVTVGGVDLASIDPETMESRQCPGLYFAGEVMDVDGPTGGYNLHAAFATAQLVVTGLAKRLGRRPPAPTVPSSRPPRRGKRRRPRKG